MPPSKCHIKIVALFCILLSVTSLGFADQIVTAAESNSQPQQRIQLNLPGGKSAWKVGAGFSTPYSKNVTLIPRDENMSSTGELIDLKIAPYQNGQKIDARTITYGDIEHAKQTCTQVNYNILKLTPAYSIYQLTTQGCRIKGYEGSQQIVKLFNGLDAVYSVRYAIINNMMSAQRFAMMENIVENSKLVSQ